MMSVVKNPLHPLWVNENEFGRLVEWYGQGNNRSFCIVGCRCHFVQHKCTWRLKQNQVFKFIVLVILPWKKNGGLNMIIKKCYSIILSILYTGCNRRNVRDFGRMFLRSNYTDITQNTYIQSWTVTEIMAIEMCGLLGCRRTVPRPWCHTCPMRLPGNETW